MEIPVINIGVISEKVISFTFNSKYIFTKTGASLQGEQRALFAYNKILFQGHCYDELFFEPTDPSATFNLKDVTIGVDFHWERKEELQFKGALNLIVNEESIVVINQVDVEEYLRSVISSEMNATSSIELLKAHAVISRSWLLAQIEKNHQISLVGENRQTCIQTEKELVRWYDREDHHLFDVCADDHCQRYQGITRASSPVVEEAIKVTHGELLIYYEQICDARFSKCCGGVVEQFETCWEPVPHPYLTALRDSTDMKLPDLTIEEEAEEWIQHIPESFCNTQNKNILEQVLNDYDQETSDFYRWKVSYSQKQLADLIHLKSEVDFGDIVDLKPVKRGPSGRLEKLTIVGTNKELTIGKELEIRRILSESHLYSSAFVVKKEPGENNIPSRFTFVGAGWGHGVGLCQIGAAVMAAKGYTYREILAHYYPGTTLEKKY